MNVEQSNNELLRASPTITIEFDLNNVVSRVFGNQSCIRAHLFFKPRLPLYIEREGHLSLSLSRQCRMHISQLKVPKCHNSS